MYQSKPRFISTIGILIALTILLQLLGRYIPLGPNNNFIIGSLVNACLFISTATCGLWGGAVVGVISPLGASLTGSAIPLIFIPFIQVGNFLLVLFYHLLKQQKAVGILVAAVIKVVFLYVSIINMLQFMSLLPRQAGMMLFIFGWPQLITALIGGAIAMFLLKKIHRYTGTDIGG